ncbi:peptidase C39 family protein, partial [Streptomyces decoyicus]
MTSSAPRRTVLAAALAAAAGVAAPSAQAAGTSRRPAAAPAAAATPATATTPDAAARRPKSLVDYHAWTTASDWTKGHAKGTAVAHGARPGIRLAHPAGTSDYKDPHTGKTAAWEYATWTSPVHRLKVPATEVIASWNAHTPSGTWIAVELRGTYT